MSWKNCESRFPSSWLFPKFLQSERDCALYERNNNNEKDTMLRLMHLQLVKRCKVFKTHWKRPRQSAVEEPPEIQKPHRTHTNMNTTFAKELFLSHKNLSFSKPFKVGKDPPRGLSER